jgi:hypothetical protein
MLEMKAISEVKEDVNEEYKTLKEWGLIVQAFHNDPSIKEKYLERVLAHRAADEIMQGVYWENGKGCAVGCTIHGDNHAAYEVELGIPRILARLEDRIFEGLSLEDAKEWPEKFLRAIPVGKDLSLVWPKFAVWLLVDEIDGVIKFAKTDQQKEVIARVADLYQRRIKGDEPSLEEWRTAAHAADAADAAAAHAADAADAAYAAYAAAAAAAAYAAAAAAYAADAAAAARKSAYKRQSEKLLEILGERNGG